MKLFSYVLAADDGAAPNPLWGYCTLAICKPKIRKGAMPEDWVIGIGPAGKPTHGKLIYAMRVDDKLPLDEYFTDHRFQMKKPAMASRDPRRHVGDNVYFKEHGRWRKLPGGTHTHANMKKDLSGRNASISRHFYYFGNKAMALPPHLQRIAQGGRGHRTFGPTETAKLAEWLDSKFQPGIRGDPAGMAPAACAGRNRPMRQVRCKL